MDKTERQARTGRTSDGGDVSIREAELGALIQIAGWEQFDDAAAAALRAVLLSLPENFRQSLRIGEATLWRIAPERVLVMSANSLDLESSDDLAVLDLSDARLRLVMEGHGAADLLSRVMALDFSQAAFPVGTFMQGALQHVGVLVDRRAAERFELLIPTTWASSLTELMANHLLHNDEIAGHLPR